ncbi:4548_t:CDS:2, partial [Ambispora gerdemannii]
MSNTMGNEKDLTAEQKGAIVRMTRTAPLPLLLVKIAIYTSPITTTLAAQTKRNVSRNTVRHELHKENLWSRIARPKPLISTVNAERRLAWCLARKDWTARHFRRVSWSDESTFCLFQQSSCRVWREPHEEWDIECVRSTVKHNPSQMHWGCFSWYGTGPLVALNGSATGTCKSHIEILRSTQEMWIA